MNNSSRILILVLFAAAAALLLFGPARQGARHVPGGEIPAQNNLPHTDLPMMIEFYSEDCGICARLMPTVRKLQEQYSDRIEFVFVDANDMRNLQLLKEFGIDGLPTFYWVRHDRKILDAMAGPVPEETIRKNIETLLEIHRADSVPET